MSKTTRDRSLFVAALLILLTLLLSGAFLGKTASRQFNEQYAERLRSGLTTYGVLLNFTNDGFVKSVQALGADARLQDAIANADSKESLNGMLLEGSVQIGSDSLHLIDPEGKPVTSFARSNHSHPGVSACFTAAGGVVAHAGSLYLSRATRLARDGKTLGYLCGTLEITPREQSAQLKELLHGTPFLHYKGSSYFYDKQYEGANDTQEFVPGEPIEWQYDNQSFYGMTGYLAVGGEEVGIGLLIPNTLYQGEMRKAALAVIFSLTAMLLIGLFALRTMIRQQLTQHKLNQAKEQALVTLSSIGDSVITTDSSGNIIFINGAAERLMQLEPKAVIGRPWNDIIQLQVGLKGQAVDVVSASLKARKAVFSTEETELHCNGVNIPVTYTAAPISRYGINRGSVIVLHDVSEERALHRELEWRASHDELTGLPNRRSFHQAVTAALQCVARSQQTAALMFLDLDKFKVVNDTCGHDAGDKLLVQVCEEFRRNLRAEDLLARMGGDEFAILLHNTSESDACQVASKLIQQLKQFRFEFDGREFQIGVSIGLQMIDAHSGDLGEVIRQADLACYEAKKNGRSRCCISPGENADAVAQKLTEASPAIES